MELAIATVNLETHCKHKPEELFLRLYNAAVTLVWWYFTDNSLSQQCSNMP